jgi:Trk-type K+ transport system membrane component
VILTIARTENTYLTNHPDEVNLWYIMFELISAFGMVGTSLGVPNRPYSLVGKFTSFGKLLVMLTFWMGKNRAMPKLTDPVIDFHFSRLKVAIKHYGANHAEIPDSMSSDSIIPKMEMSALHNDEYNFDNEDVRTL